MSKYDDIIDMPYHKSTRHPAMSINDRAAQFAPFAALNGHQEAIDETARETAERITLDDDQKQLINQKLVYIATIIKQKPEVIITYFIKDKKKNGGYYKTTTAKVIKIDDYTRQLYLDNEEIVTIDDIYQLEIIK